MSAQQEQDTVQTLTPEALAPAPLEPPAQLSVHVDTGGLSHPGRVRPNNEDSFLVVRFERALETLLTNLPQALVPKHFEEVAYGMGVADGMGGHLAGEVASRMALTALVNMVLYTPDWIMRMGEKEGGRIMRRMSRHYLRIDARLEEEARKNPVWSGMGTTLTLACSAGKELFVGHVGDSRVYCRRRGRLIRLTRDHTFAQALVEAGAIRADTAASHHLRHVLTRALGARSTPADADVQRLLLEDGDEILLCTDGLTEMVDDDTISGALGAAATASEACQALVDLALTNGGKDNVTAVVARYSIGPMPPRNPTPANPSGSRWTAEQPSPRPTA